MLDGSVVSIIILDDFCMNDDIAVVLVTYNRVALLAECLESLRQQTREVQRIFVINNASTDTTAEYLSLLKDENITVINNDVNTGGAGGFSQGLKIAYEQGYDWALLIDDDVLLDSHCIEALMLARQPAMIAVRENKQGVIAEMAALEFDLESIFILKPKRAAVCDRYSHRQEMPERFEVENVSFEGFIVHRDVVSQVGFPEEKYFIFYDDVDYALRIREAGYKIQAIRDAAIIRQLDYSPSQSDSSWKLFYIYRNFFHIHYKYGSNFYVRNRILLIFFILVIVNLFKMRISSLKVITSAFIKHKKLDH